MRDYFDDKSRALDDARCQRDHYKHGMETWKHIAYGVMVLAAAMSVVCGLLIFT